MEGTLPETENDTWTQSPYSNHARLAMKLAHRAGTNMIPYCESIGTIINNTSSLDVRTLITSNKDSHGIDLCTHIDIENENIIIHGIQEMFPHHVIIGEESVGTGTIPSITNEPTWIIDPIDGTTNFANGIPLSCVSIAFCMDRIPVMGVVYAPLLKEWYMAMTGHGAYRNGIRLLDRRCGNVDRIETSSAMSTKALRDAVVCFEFGYVQRDESAVDTLLTGLRNVLLHGCRTTRQFGSGVLDMCYVATGRVDVVYAGLAGEGWKPWDYAAAMVIIQETGAIIETLDGMEPFDVTSKSILCATTSSLATELRCVLFGNTVK
jgi:inositol-phosphate phosphatase / L-galactose 1-phosphate phosphatase